MLFAEMGYVHQPCLIDLLAPYSGPNMNIPLAQRVYHTNKPGKTAEDIRKYDNLLLERTPIELRQCYQLKRELRKRREHHTPDWETAVYAMNTATLEPIFLSRAKRNYNRTHSSTGRSNPCSAPKLVPSRI